MNESKIWKCSTLRGVHTSLSPLWIFGHTEQGQQRKSCYTGLLLGRFIWGQYTWSRLSLLSQLHFYLSKFPQKGYGCTVFFFKAWLVFSWSCTIFQSCFWAFNSSLACKNQADFPVVLSTCQEDNAAISLIPECQAPVKSAEKGHKSGLRIADIQQMWNVLLHCFCLKKFSCCI